MYITSRSYLTAGIAALGVGAIALTPEFEFEIVNACEFANTIG